MTGVTVQVILLVTITGVEVLAKLVVAEGLVVVVANGRGDVAVVTTMVKEVVGFWRLW